MGLSPSCLEPAFASRLTRQRTPARPALSTDWRTRRNEDVIGVVYMMTIFGVIPVWRSTGLTTPRPVNSRNRGKWFQISAIARYDRPRLVRYAVNAVSA